ncbi:a152 [Rat cytomegalovirus ALL-03]|uniref:A152 n=2 Tax=Rat cytomegalovirus (isolate England) TaxID=1261657 RepID=A0A0F6TGV5_RCMVE|nr:e152 [Murid betaherpesvirus 8]AKE44300.1 a152 [Rat cytomegalovirus ALL-03]AFX83450.1 e152 [Murid betaherpesvirus 8]WEG71923.1 membrane protein e147 [Murid betaherpesvirus 8]WPH25313.1 membrane protein e147 [Murid betaherpesvirus 8]WPH25446.1 membrane protein e147 [Murid betaherpesvirus 8]
MFATKLYVVLSLLCASVLADLRVEVDDSHHVNICNPGTLIIDIDRGQGQFFSNSVYLNGTKTLLFDAYGSMRHKVHEMLKNEKHIQEFSFMALQKPFLNEIVNLYLEWQNRYLLRYQCNLASLHCIVLFKVYRDSGFADVMTYDGTSVTFSDIWKDYAKTGVTQNDLVRYAYGTGMKFIRSHKNELRSKWTSLCLEIADQDKPRNNVYTLMQRSAHSFTCNMKTKLPLGYTTSFYRADEASEAKTMLQSGQDNFYSEILLNDGDIHTVTLENIICEVKSSTGWSVMLRHSLSAEPQPGMVISEDKTLYGQELEVKWHSKHPRDIGRHTEESHRADGDYFVYWFVCFVALVLFSLVKIIGGKCRFSFSLIVSKLRCNLRKYVRVHEGDDAV